MSFPTETPNPSEHQRPAFSDHTLAIAVYAFYGLSYFTAFSALIGVIIAHVKIADAEPMVQSHYRFQIRTFWIGLAYVAAGLLLMVAVVGFAILIWWFVWSLVRTVKGGLLLLDNKPIANPDSWLFG
jgi:uncharacterized membrane protein